eukprot:snap_masked-scaffold585_size130225-processed-gene-0.8 protein:Tk05229 transcript:snap_masked-scaffold585_size130225-processed-gene-0.8-mRNA-1 annotation:"ubiquitin"
MASAKDSEDKGVSEQLNLKVIGQDGQLIQFKIKKSTPFRKLMNAYCDRQKLSQSAMRFMFDGNRLLETDTPKSMDMEDGDTIEVFTQQTGGVEEPRPAASSAHGPAHWTNIRWCGHDPV